MLMERSSVGVSCDRKCETLAKPQPQEQATQLLYSTNGHSFSPCTTTRGMPYAMRWELQVFSIYTMQLKGLSASPVRHRLSLEGISVWDINHWLGVRQTPHPSLDHYIPGSR